MKYQAEVLKQFPEQIQYAIAAYKNHGIQSNDIDNILICGLGGSGIAGHITKNYLLNKISKPLAVISDYDVPSYTSNRSLVILSSYSGNTEETLSMYHKAMSKNAKILILSSGGELSELAKKNKQQVYQALPNHQPRMALGFSLSYLLLIFSEIFTLEVEKDLNKAIPKLRNWESYLAKADIIFDAFKDRLNDKIVFVCDNFMEAVGTRASQQIQENAKNEAFVQVLPETNHNVLESLHQKLPGNFLLLNSGHSARNQHRFQFLEKVLQDNSNNYHPYNDCNTSLESVLETIYVLDWLSLRIADALQRKSEQVPVITALKKFLSEV